MLDLWSHKHSGGIFSPVSEMHGRILFRLITVTRDSDDVNGSEVKVTDIFG